MPRFFLISLCICPAVLSLAAEPAGTATPTPAEESSQPRNPAPTFADVSYGDHERQKIDFWQAKSDRPTPVVFYVHGGGWVRGDKNGIRRVDEFLKAGISVVSVNYRYTWQAQEAGINPPVKAPMEDIKRALQFVRSKAKEWNIDKERIGGWGGSAGGCSLLWLALRDDMVDPKSSDPVARESTRLWCAGLNGPQTTLDPKLMREWTPNSVYGGHAFGFMDPKDIKSRDTRFEEFLAHRDELLPLIEEYSPLTYAGAGDPPLCLVYDYPPAIGQPQKDPTHSANFGVRLKEKLQSAGVQCEVIYPDSKHRVSYDYLVKKLTE